MKQNATIAGITICVLMALIAVGCRQSDYKTATVRVPEMKNEACAKLIAVALSKQPGIEPKDIKFNKETRTVTVRYDSMKTALKNIEHAIAGVGFNANDIPAKPEAAQALPKECK